MPFGSSLRAPRHLLVLFLAITIGPATALAWLSWRILQQDRALESQRLRDRIEHTADVVVTALERRLTEVESQLAASVASPATSRTNDAMIAVFRPQGIVVHSRERLLFYPQISSRGGEPASNVFEPGEDFEYRLHDYPRAISEFRALSRSSDSSIRAGALLRLARNLRKNDETDEALRVYDSLSLLGSVRIADIPAELLARQARLVRLAELRQSPQLQREAATLYEDLQLGRWRLDRASYLFHSAEALRRLGTEPDSSVTKQRLALAEAVEWLWTEWQQTPRNEGEWRGRQSLWFNDAPVFLLWSATGDSLTALVAGPAYVEKQLQDLWSGRDVDVTLSDGEGHLAFGRPVSAGTVVSVRSATETRLPWTLRVTNAGVGSELAQLAGRRRLLLAGLVMTALLTLAGGYFTARATTRELAVARLQSDFVAAVSHEFRTPLTSLRHLTDLLRGGAVNEEDRRRQYYDVIARETERLHRLVEGLLDFGRMEAGQRVYRLAPLDPVELVENVVGEFRADIEPLGRRLELSTNGLGSKSCVVHVDREAMSLAIRNLIDNAVKYSADSRVVRVALSREAQHVMVRVTDEGFGIYPAEKDMIFQKFARGAASRELHVKGTGIGLAMVQHIVEAHGGEVRVQSEPGRGSTFTVVLRAEDNGAPSQETRIA